MSKPKNFFRNVKKLVNLRFTELNVDLNPLEQQEGGDVAFDAAAEQVELFPINKPWAQHPSFQVLILGLAMIGAVSIAQSIWMDGSTQVRVVQKPASVQEDVLPTLLKEPVTVPEGSPTAPAGIPIEIYKTPLEDQAVAAIAAPKANPVPDWTKSRKPIRGQVIAGYSFGYNDFFDDYRLHEGIDYAAPKGTAVVAVLDGSVEAIYEHKHLGKTVVIDHGAGWQSSYAPLENIDIIPGQWIAGGDQLGKLGPPPLIEKDAGTHLHFELHQQGESLDPTIYIK